MLKRLPTSEAELESYASFEPIIDLRRHLNGPMKSEGIIYGPTGRVVSQFIADMEGVWDGNSGELREFFRFASGATDQRVWKITVDESEQTYSATAGDIVGSVHGVLDGIAARSRYKLRLGPDAGGHVVSVDDWMYLSESGVILNRSRFRKFGIKVGELFATLRPL